MKKRKVDEEPSRPRRSSDRSKNKAVQGEAGGSSAVRTKSTAGKKTKKKGPDLGPSETEVAPERNTYEMHISECRKLRCSNPYHWPKRTYTGGDKMFWTNTQYAFWADFIYLRC